MILPYLGRFFCLALGAFFLIHTAASLAVCFVAPKIVRCSVSFEPKLAAQFLFGLRLLPVVISGMLVLAFFIPAYLLFEPQRFEESVGLSCLAASAGGAILLASGLLRGLVAMLRSPKYLRKREESGAPVIMVAGLFRTRLVVSPSIRELLTPEELDVALRHEEAHGRARDNLKRLLILMCPTVLPLCHGFRTLEAGWQRLAEWAADDWAAQPSAGDALALASALIRVGRMNARVTRIALGTSLLADVTDLRTRVERLIEGPQSYPRVPISSILGFLTLVVLSVIGLSPTLLPATHRLLEALAH